jgi:hypothetical protein
MPENQVTDQPDATRCVRCGESLYPLGVVDFRVGGRTGGAHLLLGQWAEVGESKIDFEVLACPACRRIELRIPPEA